MVSERSRPFSAAKRSQRFGGLVQRRMDGEEGAQRRQRLLVRRDSRGVEAGDQPVGDLARVAAAGIFQAGDAQPHGKRVDQRRAVARLARFENVGRHLRRRRRGRQARRASRRKRVAVAEGVAEPHRPALRQAEAGDDGVEHRLVAKRGRPSAR
jgi:hypothetical protein